MSNDVADEDDWEANVENFQANATKLRELQSDGNGDDWETTADRFATATNIHLSGTKCHKNCEICFLL